MSVSASHRNHQNIRENNKQSWRKAVTLSAKFRWTKTITPPFPHKAAWARCASWVPWCPSCPGHKVWAPFSPRALSTPPDPPWATAALPGLALPCPPGLQVPLWSLQPTFASSGEMRLTSGRTTEHWHFQNPSSAQNCPSKPNPNLLPVANKLEKVF